jgi:hypothetical protein
MHRTLLVVVVEYVFLHDLLALTLGLDSVSYLHAIHDEAALRMHNTFRCSGRT